MKKHLLFIGFFFLVSSCATTNHIFNKKKKFSNAIQLNDIKVSPKKNNLLLPAKSKEIDILHADIQMSFDWSKHTCIGTETILLKPYFYAIDSIVLNAQNMVFSKVEVKNLQGEIIQNLTSYDKKKLKIQLEKK